MDCETDMDKSGQHNTCIFPFVYNGVTYCECTDVDQAKPWCSIKVDENQNYIGDWYFCKDNCFEGRLIHKIWD